MTEHRFKIGSRVTLSKRMSVSRGGEYEVVRHLPSEDGAPQYRLKSRTAATERVAKEYELKPWKV